MSSLRKTTLPTKPITKKQPTSCIDASSISILRNDSMSSMFSAKTRSIYSSTLDIDLKKNSSDDLIKKIEVILNFVQLKIIIYISGTRN